MLRMPILKKWIRLFTFLGKEEIESLISNHQADPSKRILQKRLAEEITVFVHGNDGLEHARQTTAKIFHQQHAPAESMSIEDLEGLQGIVHIGFPLLKLESGMDVVSFLAETAIFPSKGEARKTVQNGGVSINRHKVGQVSDQVGKAQLLHGRYLLVQKGKKNYFLVKGQ